MSKDLLRDEMTEFFISVEYERMYPINLFNCTAEDINGRKEKAIRLYRNDPVFHARVDYLISSTIRIVDSFHGG